ncbi:hypothetical protein HPB48_026000 [Haemaphysalis longicornis]|uniref:Transposase Tc1-like domain-containing protein n=1 Tax=Haemaphysalis longicornis TaxID=44386 RepID=A0A9J6HAL7_HAELO|nr:hypothetical protein HPB48_026000 [Haemaphysalis longicornis]
MQSALDNNKAGPSRTGSRGLGAKRARNDTTSESDSDSDSLCAKSELRKVLEDKKFWKERALTLEKEKKALFEQLTSLQQCLHSKIFDRPMGISNNQETFLSMQWPPLLPLQITGHMKVLVTKSSQVEPLFHLAKGVTVSAVQAAKILGNKKATLVCKDAAQAIWTSEVLATKSVSGHLPPAKRSSGVAPKDPLTPLKVDVVAATVEHWGRTRKLDVSGTLVLLPRILTEKIQDVTRALRKKAELAKKALEVETRPAEAEETESPRVRHGQSAGKRALSDCKAVYARHQTTRHRYADEKLIKTVNRIIQAYRTERRIKDSPQKPRYRVTSSQEDLNIIAVAAAKPGASVREICQKVGAHASKTTIKRRLHEAGLKSQIAAQKLLLRVANKEVAVCSATHVLDDTKLGEDRLFRRMHLHEVLGPEGSCLVTHQQPVSSLWLINLVT